MRFKAWEKKNPDVKLMRLSKTSIVMDMSGTFRVVHPEKKMFPGCVN